MRRLIVVCGLHLGIAFWSQNLTAEPPVITQPPLSASVYEGADAFWSVTATGTGLNYAWLFNGANTVYPNAASFTLPNVTPQLGGLYSVRISNPEGAVTSPLARLRVRQPGLDHTRQQRPWVRILRTDDVVPGSSSPFGPLVPPFGPLFTLHDRTVHAVARADGDALNPAQPKTALVRWRDGQLTTLVFTNTPRPAGGGSFGYPFYPTDEGDGAVNFAEGYMYEWRAGQVAAVIDSATPVPGRPGAAFFGLGSFARRGPGVAISAGLQLGSPGVQGTGLFFHDGATLTRLADDSTDLPGVLAGYAARLTEDSVNYDGATVVFSTMTSLNGEGGVYRVTPGGPIVKLLDTGDLIPGLTNQVVSFGDVDVEGGLVFAVVGTLRNGATQNRIVKFEADGAAAAIGFGDYLAASGPRQVYFGTSGSIQRWTDGALETLINTQAILEGHRIKTFLEVEAQGDDVAIGVEFRDGTAGIYANFGAPKPGSPQILAHPQPTATPETAPTTFAVAAVGPPPLACQWFKDGVPIPHATNATYTIPSTGPTHLGIYHAVINPATDAIPSALAPLSLEPPPAKPLVFFQPMPVTVPIGSPATLRIGVAGAGPITYTWKKGTQIVAEGPSPELHLPTTAPADHASFTVVAANANGATPSFVASLSLTPVINQQPAPQIVSPGGTATFTVLASGFAELRYLWYKGSTPLTAQTNATLTLENVQASDAGTYSVSVAGVGGGNLRSASAELTVDDGGAPPAPRLESPTYQDRQLTFRLATVAGTTYEVQFKARWGDAPWSVRNTFVGDASTQTVVVTVPEAVGIIRVAARPSL